MKAPVRRGLLRRLRAAYQRLPLPLFVKRLVGGVYRLVFVHTPRALRRRRNAHKVFQWPLPNPQGQNPQLPDYIIWGAIDWDFRYQRPQQLAQALSATGRRVIYVSAALEDDERAGFTLQPLDMEGRLFEVRLFARGAPTIYANAPDAATVRQLRRSCGEVLAWLNATQLISLIQHPFWYAIGSVLPNSRLVYDCMDHHEGFGNNGAEILQLERQLVREAELTVFASAWLARHWAEHAKARCTVIRNASDFSFFARAPAEPYRDRQGRRIIGYYGAIAEWFDQALIAAVAEVFTDCVILLIGADTAQARVHLRAHSNIEFLGEVPYVELPYYLHGFDVCLLPFRIDQLTRATNPVKVYEYLSAGKPVVAVDLPEMQQFGQGVQIAQNRAEFLAAIALALGHPVMAAEVRQRQAFASQQTWTHRTDALIALAENHEHDALVSVIVLTYNNLALTQACLASIEADQQSARVEIIVVDNASSDGTPAFLRQWAASSGQRIILNTDNRGFAAANNQGLAIARGDYLVLLNNDTQVTAGWAVTLRRHLQRDPGIGLIGPVTNNIGNAAKIDIAYSSLASMPAVAQRFTCRHMGDVFGLPTLGFFCVMLARSTYERVGPLDEAFGQGFFEDDDYCRRVEQAGLYNACAEDVFIHHQLSASFDQMNASERQALFARNKALYEAKWGEWIPHVHRMRSEL